VPIIANDVLSAACAFTLSDSGRWALRQIRETHALPSLRVLTPAQFATLEYLVETIHPQQGGAPGGMDSRAADYIDILLSESDDVTKLEWLNGLAELDIEARAGYGIPFGRLEDIAKKALVEEFYRRGPAGDSTLQSFIHLVDQATAFACGSAGTIRGH
jgi:hypothetical protein